jgi:hypothetical protein
VQRDVARADHLFGVLPADHVRVAERASGERPAWVLGVLELDLVAVEHAGGRARIEQDSVTTGRRAAFEQEQMHERVEGAVRPSGHQKQGYPLRVAWVEVEVPRRAQTEAAVPGIHADHEPRQETGTDLPHREVLAKHSLELRFGLDVVHNRPCRSDWQRHVAIADVQDSRQPPTPVEPESLGGRTPYQQAAGVAARVDMKAQGLGGLAAGERNAHELTAPGDLHRYARGARAELRQCVRERQGRRGRSGRRDGRGSQSSASRRASNAYDHECPHQAHAPTSVAPRRDRALVPVRWVGPIYRQPPPRPR